MKKPQIYLIDGSAYVYRAFHALPHLSTSKGVPTNAIFGVTNMLLKLMKDKQPEYVAIFFDVKGKTFRHQIYPDYKANRPPMPDELVQQIPLIKEVINAFNIPIIEKEGFEADDLIGTYSRIAKENGYNTIIVTGDKDFMQLVTDSCVIWDPMKDKFIDKEVILKDFNIEPEKVIDMLGLAGDSSDNVPGVPGVGPKTALKLIVEYGSIKNIYDNIERLESKKSLYIKLLENKEQALLSQQLVTINQFVDIKKIANTSNPIDNLRVKSYDNNRLIELFKTFEFKKLHQEFFEENEDRPTHIKNYQCLTDIAAIENLVKEIGTSRFAIDTETTSLNPVDAELVGISISFKPHHAVYIPIGHVNSDNTKIELFKQNENSAKEAVKTVVQPDKNAVLAVLKPLLENPDLEKVGQNIKYDYIVFARNGIRMKGIAFDTMIGSYLLNSSGRGHGLDQIALDLLGHKNITYDEVISTISENNKNRTKQPLFSEVSIEKATEYACEDADTTLLVHDILREKIKENHLDELMHTVEMPLIPVLAQMEMNGIKVDREKLSELSKGFEQELERIEQDIFAIAGEKFNVNSSQQLGHILFEKLKLPVQKKTKKKTGYSTDIAVLTELAGQHDLPAMVLRYRSLGKLKSTYTDALRDLINPETGRIHTSFNQAVTATGRLSSSEPNLQNIPIRTEEGRQIREAFIAHTGCRLISADYSQVELRILAHVADDKILIDAFENDEDIHARTATEVFQAMPNLIDAELRRQAKAINFGIVYGMGAFKLSNELGISRKMAQTYIDNYFARYSGVKRYIDTIIEKAKSSGEVTTLFGRKRRLEDIHSSNANVRGLAERMAINTPIQGSAADIIKLAMIRMDKALKETFIASDIANPDQIKNGKKITNTKPLEAKMLLSVHDEILFEVPENEVEIVIALARQVMEGVCQLKVPLKVNISTGANWAEAH